ncbi:MAG: OmpA family protein [Bacteriovoracaceae bacterium]|jgi:outer membrane protein OmpA-like peptidoglycan-associated protein|nr:OmpA family protein [Bacteriovoracaceae bacterium]
MRYIIIAYLSFFLYVLLGHAPTTTVVLMPDEDGGVGRVTVNTQQEEYVLTEPGTFVQVTERISPPGEMDQETIDRVFGPALEMQVPLPVSFHLYFQSGSSIPDAASSELLPEIVQLINERPYPQVSIIGHTDTMGDKDLNNRLSLERAEAIRNMLADQGVPREIMEVSAHGQNDPLVPTGPNVSEPRNRRVEILVR